VPLEACCALWTLHRRTADDPDDEPGTELGAEGSAGFHALLVITVAAHEVGGKYEAASTLVLDTSKEPIEPVEGGGGFATDGATIGCGNALAGRRIVQIVPLAALLLDADGLECVHRVDGWGGPKLSAVASAFCGDYCLLVLSDGSLRLLSVGLDELTVVSLPRSEHSYTAACLHRLSPLCALFAGSAPDTKASAARCTGAHVAALARAGGGVELVEVPSWAPLFESLPVTAEPMVLLPDVSLMDARADAPTTPRKLLSPSNSFGDTKAVAGVSPAAAAARWLLCPAAAAADKRSPPPSPPELMRCCL
jgi:hypothetical protein